MSENIIAKTNVGGDVWEVPITVSGDNRESIREGEMLAIKIKNPKTMASYLVAGVVTGLEPINGVEDRNKEYIEYTRSRSNEIENIDGYALELKIRETTYYKANFKIYNVIETDPIDGVKSLNALPRPILPGEAVVDAGDFIEKLESTLNLEDYSKFGRIPSKKIKGGYDNLILKPNHDNSAKHIGIFADTGQGKSSVLLNLLKIYSGTDINLLGIDPKSQMYGESLASSKNFIDTVHQNNREIYNLSIFDDIILDLNHENLVAMAKAYNTFNNKATFNIGNKAKFIDVFLDILLKEKPELIKNGSEVQRDDVIFILQKFKEDTYATQVYAGVSNPRPLEAFKEKVTELLNDNYRIRSIQNNLNKLIQYFSSNEKKWSIEEIIDEFLTKKSSKTKDSDKNTIIFIHPGSKNDIPDWVKEKHLSLIVSKLIERQKKLLSDSNFKQTKALFFADEADMYFPNKTENIYQENAIKDIKELLNNWARSKGLGFAFVNPDPLQLDSEIFERIKNKILLLGYGIQQSVINQLSKNLTSEAFKELKTLDPLDEDKKTGLMISCQFFAIGLRSAIDPNGKGMLIEFSAEDF